MKKGKIKLGKTTSLSTLNLTYTMRMVIVAFFMIDGGGGAAMGVFRKLCCYLRPIQKKTTQIQEHNLVNMNRKELLSYI
ncbi:hypothetical protein [Rossellomorea vietnamensis]|uniref:hypothetical protein n=1 Tax=Rossellomorea vietnamensis TaxID=218284 RepID=UPI002078CEDF|nr:hypothetical protein [Rossellomorea vietnamensis]